MKAKYSGELNVNNDKIFMVQSWMRKHVLSIFVVRHLKDWNGNWGNLLWRERCENIAREWDLSSSNYCWASILVPCHLVKCLHLSEDWAPIDLIWVPDLQMNFSDFTKLIGPWKISKNFQMNNFPANFHHWWLRYLFWNCPPMNVTVPNWW